MIPLRDTLTPTRVPHVTRALFVINASLFLFQVVAGPAADTVVRTLGFVPARLATSATLVHGVLTLFTSLFLHGGLVHLGGNLLYLWIFGDDVEERLGHARYLLAYLIFGAAGSLTHALFFPFSAIPSIGASGSIAGILGVFLAVYPQAKIVTLVPLVVSYAMIELPSLVYLPIWFLMQFANGWLAVTRAATVETSGGVAWWAHIGGFLVGLTIGIVARRADRPGRITS